jgi:hypothetical protein
MDEYERKWYRGENLDDQDGIFLLEEEECSQSNKHGSRRPVPSRHASWRCDSTCLGVTCCFLSTCLLPFPSAWVARATWEREAREGACARALTVLARCRPDHVGTRAKQCRCHSLSPSINTKALFTSQNLLPSTVKEHVWTHTWSTKCR